MTNNNLQTISRTKPKNWIYILLLYISFIWTSIYPVMNALVNNYTFGYGNLFDLANPNFTSIIFILLIEALFSLAIFEIIFAIYRWILQFKIYSFIVPTDKLKNESRLYFIYRNIILGIFINLCFFHPYLYIFVPFADIVITMAMVILYTVHLNKTYSEPIVSHFVFKNFCYPIFVFEAIMILIQVVGVI